jgi:hypothetical protein
MWLSAPQLGGSLFHNKMCLRRARRLAENPRRRGRSLGGSRVLVLSYAQQRWYDPRTGRFLSEDPVGQDLASRGRAERADDRGLLLMRNAERFNGVLGRKRQR